MTPAEIAAGLTKAQRQAVLKEKTSLGPVAYALRRRGVMAYEPTGNYSARQALTPLGLAVRAILERQADHG